MVKAHDLTAAVDADPSDVSPARGGGHAGHSLGFLVAAQLSPFVSIVMALALVAGGIGATGWMWLAVGAVALPAIALFGLAVFLAEHGFE